MNILDIIKTHVPQSILSMMDLKNGNEVEIMGYPGFRCDHKESPGNKQFRVILKKDENEICVSASIADGSYAIFIKNILINKITLFYIPLEASSMLSAKVVGFESYQVYLSIKTDNLIGLGRQSYFVTREKHESN